MPQRGNALSPGKPGSSLVVGFLFLALGLARGTGGVALLAVGPAAVGRTQAGPAEARAAAASLLVVAVAALATAAGVVGPRRWAYALGRATLALFVAGGALNGALLFGAPRLAGLAGNVAVALLMLVVLEAARRHAFPAAALGPRTSTGAGRAGAPGPGEGPAPRAGGGGGAG